MTVYIVQQPIVRHNNWTPDFSTAAEYGKLQYVFPSHYRAFALPGPAIKKAAEEFKDFDPEKDFLLWPNTGDPAALMACCFSLVKLGFKNIKVLYWNRKRDNRKYGFYAPIEFDLSTI